MNIDEIMERLQRLSKWTNVCMRPSGFPSGSPAKWYVTMGQVIMPGSCADSSGTTPEEAIQKTWETIKSAKHPIMRYFCKPDENIPADGPQVWVLWNSVKDDWEDAEPNKDWSRRASKIRPYTDHKWMEKL